MDCETVWCARQLLQNPAVLTIAVLLVVFRNSALVEPLQYVQIDSLFSHWPTTQLLCGKLQQ